MYATFVLSSIPSSLTDVQIRGILVDVSRESSAIVQPEVAVYTTKGNIGIEFMLPNEAWRTKFEGAQVLMRLLGQLSPYKDVHQDIDLNRLADQSTCFLLASDLGHNHHGHTVGVARLEVHRSDGVRYGQVHDVVVATTHQRQGIGKALAKKALEVASGLNLPYVEASIKPKLTRDTAGKMFQSLGFKLIATADPAVPGSANRYRFDFPKPPQKPLAH